MKAELKNNGALIVTATIEIESYALEHWIKEYNDHNAILQVITDLTIANLEKQ